MQAGFIGDSFSWKRAGLAKVGGERHRQNRVRVVKGWGGLRPVVRQQRARVLCSEELHGWQDEGEEVTY